jgi:hypothetical protein
METNSLAYFADAATMKKIDFNTFFQQTTI